MENCTPSPLDRQDLLELGYDVIPCWPGTKKPVLEDWQKTPPAEQWRSAPAGCNVGLRHGGALRLASMEAERDHPEAIPALRRFLAGLGYDWQSYPANRTAHVGERYFFAFLDAPAGSSRKMHADFGGGELRFGAGAHALIAPSTLADGGRYEELAGAWDGELPKLTRADLAPLLKDGRWQDEPVEVIAGPLSSLAQVLADSDALPEDVRGRLHGRGASDYASIDDFKTVYRLAALGIDEDSALALMLAHPGYGHFSDLAAKNSAAAVTWLHDAYAKASAYVAKNGGDVSKHLARLMEQAEAQPWPGRTGATDKSVYLAHLRIAHSANTPMWAGAARRLADMTNIGRVTATRATHRLIQAGMLELHRPATAELACEYALPTDGSARSEPILYGGTYLIGSVCATIPAVEDKTPPPSVCVRGDSGVTLAAVQAILAHDLFCWHGMNKAAGLVFAALLDEPGTVAELATRTGRHPGTVKRALSKLAAVCDDATGEVYALVEETEPGTWEIADGANLDYAAGMLGVAGKGAQRRAKHEAERQRRDAALEPYKDGAPVPHPTEPPKKLTPRERRLREVRKPDRP